MKALNPNAVGLSAGLLSAICMLIMGILAMAGIYMEAFEVMKAFHIGFDATAGGTVWGIIEAFVFSYVFGYLFAVFYNKFA